MLDPLSALSAPPPRYLLESDSSDEEGQGVYGDSSTRAPKLRTTAPPVRVQWLDGKAAYTSAVVGIGQAGRYLQRRAGARLAALTLEGSAGTGFALPGGGLLLVLEDGECADEVVRVLVSEVDVKSWYVRQERGELTSGRSSRRTSRRCTSLPALRARSPSTRLCGTSLQAAAPPHRRSGATTRQTTRPASPPPSSRR
jgi:hypothetical protein